MSAESVLGDQKEVHVRDGKVYAKVSNVLQTLEGFGSWLLAVNTATFEQFVLLQAQTAYIAILQSLWWNISVITPQSWTNLDETRNMSE